MVPDNVQTRKVGQLRMRRGNSFAAGKKGAARNRKSSHLA